MRRTATRRSVLNVRSPPHDTPHLFNCPKDPTNLDPTSLWLRPKEATRFLQIEVGDEEEDEDTKEEKKMMMIEVGLNE